MDLKGPGHGPSVAVLGGGVTGLAAANALSRDGGVRVTLLEARATMGGIVRTDSIEGVPVEAGPDAFLAREPVQKLCAEVGLEGELVEPAVFGAYLWSRGRLRKLVPGRIVLGLPASPLAAVGAGLLSAPGALRCLADFLLPGPLEGPDVSVASVVRRRLGREVLERLVDPMMAGRRAGRTEDMSLAAADAELDALARRHRSLLLGLRKLRRRGELQAGPPLFRAPAGGLGRLVGALTRRLEGRVELRTNAPVETLVPGVGTPYVVSLTSGENLGADAVLCCLPAFAAAEVLEALNEPAARDLRAIPYADTAVGTFVYPPRGSPSLPPDGSGFLVPAAEQRTVAACTWYSQKWPAARPADGGVVLRAFVGRGGRDPVLDFGDEGLLGAVAADLRNALGLSVPPRTSRLARWDGSLPEYRVGHAMRVSRIEAALEQTPGVVLAGAAYRGSGIPDCVQGAEAAARRILDHLGRDPRTL